MKELGWWLVQAFSPAGQAYNPWYIVFHVAVLGIWNAVEPYRIGEFISEYWWLWILYKTLYLTVNFFVWAFDDETIQRQQEVR